MRRIYSLANVSLLEICAVTAVSFMLLFGMPTNAKAATVDQLLTQMQTMMEQMAKMQQQLLELKASQSGTPVSTPAAPTGSVLGASTWRFTESTDVGVTNDDIKKVQELLKLDKEIYPEGITSGFYGPATTQAIRNLQTRFGLDPVGVVGPATTALLERLISQQLADGSYPSDILDPKRPTGSVAGVSTTNTNTTTQNPLVQSLLNQVAQLQAQQQSQGTSKTNTSNGTNSAGITYIDVEIDDSESRVKVKYNNGDIKDFWVFTDEKDEIIEEIADEINVSESVVEGLVDFGKLKSTSGSDDIDEINVDVDVEDGDASVKVVYEDEDEEKFTVDEVDLDDIVEAIADELDIDEDDVLDLIEVDWNVDESDIDEINVTVEDGEAEVTVELESGDDFEFVIEEEDEDDIIEEIADMLDIDEDEVEDLIDIEFN